MRTQKWTRQEFFLAAGMLRLLELRMRSLVEDVSKHLPKPLAAKWARARDSVVYLKWDLETIYGSEFITELRSAGGLSEFSPFDRIIKAKDEDAIDDAIEQAMGRAPIRDDAHA